MYRSLLAAVLLIPAAAQAQYASPAADRPMPGYTESEQRQVDAPDERYGTTDLHHDVDQTPPPPPVPQGYGYPDYGYGGQGDQGGQGARPGPSGDPARDAGWRTPRPYARADQVDQGRADDAAHRADRAYTARLNQRRWSGYNAAPSAADPRAVATGRAAAASGYAQESQSYRAQLADHQRAMQDYQDDQARYAERIARWRARADACERGHLDACDGSN